MLGRCVELDAVGHLTPGLHEDRVYIHFAAHEGTKVSLEFRALYRVPGEGKLIKGFFAVTHRTNDDGSEIKHAFVEKDLQSSTSSTWTTPVPWQCPVCRDYCMKCTPISKFKPSDTFYKCKLCGGEFHQSHWETNSDKQCIFCKIDM